MKICIFPNDPIKAYYEKGEIKKQYFNPNNFFDEIHIFSPTDKDIDENRIKEIAGNAKIKIHPIGELNLLNYRTKLKIILKLIEKIRPDVLRSYNPLIQGWLAVKAAEKKSLPVIVSIHNNYDKDTRDFYKEKRNYINYMKFSYSKKFIEKFTISHATKIICAYRFLVPYAKNLGAKDIEVVYNRVNLEKFSPEIQPKYNFSIPTIIYVARHDPEKNHECLIRAIKNLNVKLILIGSGKLTSELKSLVKELQIENKIEFIESVQNTELCSYYTSSTFFVSSTKQGGISIPMLEAMASGLPLIIPERKNDEKEDIDDAVVFSKNDPKNFKMVIEELIQNEEKRETLKKKGLKIIKLMDGKVMEDKEEAIYKQIFRV